MEKLSKILSESSGPVLLYFSTKTCGPCQSISPQVDLLTEDLDVNRGKIDAHEDADLSSMFNVRKVPSFVVVKDSQVKEGLYGVSNMKDIRELLERASEI